MNTDYIYWTFTAAAQCVATFVALLLTGYALVLAQIEAARDRDDSLQELHTVLRASYHARLKVLAWVTAGAVILSLFVVWDNRTNDPASNLVMGVAAALDIIAMVAGLAFVVTIIDPAKYQKAAERELEQRQTDTEVQAVTSAEEFFHAFRQLEQAMRKQLNRLGLTAGVSAGERESNNNNKNSGSVRQMANALVEAEVILPDFQAELLQINKYRNLLYHGHVREADAGMVERTMRATGRVKQLAA